MKPAAPVGPSFDAGDVETIQSFAGEAGLTTRIAAIESALAGKAPEAVASFLKDNSVDDSSLAAAVAIKRVAGQINVIIHAIGILTALPYILEPGEVIEGLSLGAGNTGRAHDLVTDRCIAEFKFIEWRGGAESIRQNGLFIDLFNLASSPSSKRKVMYLVGAEIPRKFLQNNRSLTSVLSKSESAARRFRELHGDRYRTVSEYYRSIASSVEIVDLADLVPAWHTLAKVLEGPK